MSGIKDLPVWVTATPGPYAVVVEQPSDGLGDQGQLQIATSAAINTLIKKITGLPYFVTSFTNSGGKQHTFKDPETK